LKLQINELYHHGIKGQRWGIRRFQNEDGSVTAAGALRYYDDPHNARQNFNFHQKAVIASVKAARSIEAAKQIKKNLSGLGELKNGNSRLRKDTDTKMKYREVNKHSNNQNVKKAIKVGAAVTATALSAYGAYKLADYMGDKSYRSFLQSGRATVDKQIELHKMDLERDINDVLKRNGKSIKYRL